MLVRHLRGLATIAAGVAAALLSAGCSSSPSASPASTPRPAPSTAPASTAPASTAPASTAPAGYLSGFGASQSAWAAGHTPDPAGPAGNYWPRLPDGLDTYASVQFIGGRALAYVENLYPVESASGARAVVGDELPPDASIVSDTTVAGGERVVEASPTLRRLTGDDAAVLMRSSGSAYDPSQVTSLAYSAVPAGPGG